jgi:hypothetical protein
VPCRPDWDETYLAAIAADEHPGDADLYADPDNAPPAGLDDTELAALIAAARENAEDPGAGGWGRGCPAPQRASRAIPAARRPGSPPSASADPGLARDACSGASAGGIRAGSAWRRAS